MLVVLYAVIREKGKGVPCVGCISFSCRGGAPIGAGGHDPPLFEAKGDGGT